jgi:hypothetical protein
VFFKNPNEGLCPGINAAAIAAFSDNGCIPDAGQGGQTETDQDNHYASE